MAREDAVLRLILDAQAMLKQLSDVVREWVQSTARMNKAAAGVDFDLAQREAQELKQVVDQTAAGVVTSLARIEVEQRKIVDGFGADSREAQKVEAAVGRLSNSATRELSKIERAAKREIFQRFRRDVKEAEAAVTRMGKESVKEIRALQKEADKLRLQKAREEAKATEQAIKQLGATAKDIAKLEKEAEKVKFQVARDSAKATEMAIRTLAQSGARSFAILEERAKQAGVGLQAGIGGALTRLPPQVQALQRKFEAAVQAMRTASDRVSFQKAQFEAQRLEVAINRMATRAQVDIDRIRQAGTKLGSGFTRLGGIVGSLNRVLGSLGIFLSARILVRWAGDALQASIRLEAFRAQLAASTKTVAEANDLFQFATQQTERLGLSYASVVEGTARFAAATKNTNLTLAQRKDILLSVFEAARVLNLSEQRLQNTLLALEQIASKATVSMEELRRQLGDNIPGAVAILAKQMGVTQQQLLKMIETNQVLSEEALPLLAKGFRETFGGGVEASIDTFAANLGRLKKGLFDVQVAFGSGFGAAIKPDLERVGEAFKELIPTFKLLGLTLGVLSKEVLLVFEGIVLGLAKVGRGAGTLVDQIQHFEDPFIRFFRFLRDEGDSAGGWITDLGEDIGGLDAVIKGAFDDSIFSPFEEGVESVARAFIYASSQGELTKEQTNLLSEAVNNLNEYAKKTGKEAPQSLSIMVHALEAGTQEARKFGANLIAISEDIELGNLRDGIVKLSEAWNDSIQFGGLSKDLIDDFGPVIKNMALALFEAGEEIPPVLRSLAELAGVDLSGLVKGADQVSLALEDMAKRSEEAKAKIFGTVGAAEDLADQLRSLVHGLDLERLTEEQAEAIRKLLDDVKEAFGKLDRELEPDIVGIAEKLDALGFGATGVRDKIVEMTDELRQALSEVDLDNLNPEQLELFSKKIQEVIDAWNLYGEEVPPDIQAAADKLGVLSSVAEKELKKQEQLAEKAAKKEEEEAKKRVAALEKIGQAFIKLSETLGKSDKADTLEELRKQLEDLERQKFEFTGPLDELDDLDAKIAETRDQIKVLEDQQAATGEAAKDMAEKIDDAIRGLISDLEPVYARLDETQRGTIEAILTNLQQLGIDGVATGDDVASALQQMINVLEGAGQPVADLQSALREIQTGSLDVRSAFEALREEIAKSGEDIGNNTKKLKEAQADLKKEVDAHVQELARLQKAYDSSFNIIGQKMDILHQKWVVLNDDCREHRQCIEGG